MVKKKVEKNWLEWCVFGASLALVLGVLGFLAYDGARTGGAPPRIEIELREPSAHAQGFLVPVVVSNRGDTTAGDVHIEVVLEGGAAERAELRVAFLPRRSTREGFVTFHTDPRSGRLRARVLGYEKP
jgi:uncharacterized protein (TIGR02588 family)